MAKKTFKIGGMDCESCASLIAMDLEDAGVDKASCSWASETLEVDFDKDKISEDDIIKIVKKAGYSLK